MPKQKIDWRELSGINYKILIFFTMYLIGWKSVSSEYSILKLYRPYFEIAQIHDVVEWFEISKKSEA